MRGWLRRQRRGRAYSVQSSVIYTNELTRLSTGYAAAHLLLNTEQVKAGRFYF